MDLHHLFIFVWSFWVSYLGSKQVKLNFTIQSCGAIRFWGVSQQITLVCLNSGASPPRIANHLGISYDANLLGGSPTIKWEHQTKIWRKEWCSKGNPEGIQWTVQCLCLRVHQYQLKFWTNSFYNDSHEKQDLPISSMGRWELCLVAGHG